jgi:flagellar hook assembly protein FlgD
MAQGRTVRSLIDETQSAGLHTVAWDGRSDAGTSLPSGGYFYRVNAGSTSSWGKLVLAK